MRVSTMIRIHAGLAADGRLMDHITAFGRQVEARGFPGIWIGDSLGRGRPTLAGNRRTRRRRPAGFRARDVPGCDISRIRVRSRERA